MLRPPRAQHSEGRAALATADLAPRRHLRPNSPRDRRSTGLALLLLYIGVREDRAQALLLADDSDA